MPSTICSNEPPVGAAPRSLLSKLCRKLLIDVMGWSIVTDQPVPPKYVACLAPHTSNWDFVVGMLYSRGEDVRCNFLMKKEWFFWPVGPLMRRIGGIPVDRDRHTSLTDRLASIAEESETFRLCVTPEGTRSPNPDWKMGFYYIAQKARIPILLYALDYGKKAIVCTKTIVPNGDVRAQMREIKLYFKDFKGKHPENFVLGDY